MPKPYNSLEPKPWTPVDSIPLAEAVFCENCQCVTRAKNGHCPVCESASIVTVVALLDRQMTPSPDDSTPIREGGVARSVDGEMTR